MRRALAAVALAAAALTLAGCAASPSQGTVHNKDWTPGYWFTPPCFTKGCISIPEWTPPTYEIDVYASEKDHGWVGVDASTYHRLAVGDYWDGR